jgi:MSHA biogenesis protein MshJ
MIARASRWWKARNTRERWLAALAALALLSAAVEQWLLAPQRAAATAVQRDIATSRKQLDRLQQTATEMAMRHAPAAGASSLAARRARAQAQIERAQVDLITPQAMGRQLSAILARHPQLRVVGIQSLAPKPFDGNGAGLYEHGLRLEVEGRYLDLLAYLETLERAPHRIFWRSLDMKADGATPVTRLEFFTLSMEPVWLRL